MNRDDPPRAVRRQQADPLPAANAEAPQRGRGAIDAPVELGKGPALIFKRHGQPLGRDVRPLPQPVRDTQR